MDDVIKEMEKYAEEKGIPIMQKRGMNFLCKFIEKNNIKSILEIGTAIGYSAINMALVNEDITVVSIERDQDRYNEAIKNVKKASMEDKVHIIFKDALEAFDEVKYQKFDLIFIDAAKAQYIRFFEKFKSNLTEKGVIITDNLKFHGMVNDLSLTHNYSTKKLVKKIIKYIDFLNTNTEFHTDFYDDGDGISVSYKNR